MYKKGTFWERFIALIIDSVFIFLFAAIAQFASENQQLDLAIQFIVLLYGPLFIWRYGATPGKMLMKLKVVDLNYQRIGLGKALIRETLGKWISSIIFDLGYLWVLINKNRQAWHDKIAKTYVVKLDNTKNLIPISEEVVTKKQKITFTVLLIISLMISALFLFPLIYLFVAEPTVIRGSAMEPNFTYGQYYMVNKFEYRFSTPKQGDVVIHESPENPDIRFIRRIIGIPGDTVTINGAETIVPEGQYFTSADNKLASDDLRKSGLVSKELIVGKIWFCYYKCQ